MMTMMWQQTISITNKVSRTPSAGKLDNFFPICSEGVFFFMATMKQYVMHINDFTGLIK